MAPFGKPVVPWTNRYGVLSMVQQRDNKSTVCLHSKLVSEVLVAAKFFNGQAFINYFC